MKKQLKFQTLLGLVVIVSMLLAAVPMGTAKAATGTDFLGGTWSNPVTVGVTGRPTVVYDNGIYHMWYSTNDTTLFHTTSANPASFTTLGTQVAFFGATPKEDAAPAIAVEGDTFYMVAYSSDSTLKYSLWTSPVTDGTAWTYVGQVFDGTGLTTMAKIDNPFLFVDGTDIRLYTQARDGNTTPIYYIYEAGTTATTLAGLVSAPFTGGIQVLAPDATSAWDSFRVFQPWVVKDNGIYYMWYGGYSTTSTTMKLGLATSNDGETFIRSAGNPVIDAGSDANVIKVGNTWHFWYANSGVQHMTLEYPQSIAAVINPAVTTIRHGQTFKVDIIANAPYLYGVEYHLSFDPNKFSAALVAGTGLGTDGIGVNNVDNTNGTIAFAYTQTNGTAMAAPITLATITFTVKSAPTTGLTTIDLTDAKFSENDGKPIPGTITLTDANITVVADTEIHGQVTLQGRPAGAGTFAGTLVTLKSGTTSIATSTTGTLAQFAFTGLDAGTYNMIAEKNGYLDVVWAATTLDPGSTIVPTVMLLGGDTNNDNAVNNLDLAAIGTDFSTVGTTAVDDTTDINGDGIVNIYDLTMVGANYGKGTQAGTW